MRREMKEKAKEIEENIRKKQEAAQKLRNSELV